MNALHHRFPAATTIACRCCYASLDPADFRPDLFKEPHARAVEDAYDGPVCTECMDCHVVCSVTGAAIWRHRAVRDTSGDWFATQDILDKWGTK